MRYGIIGCGMMGQEHIRNINLLDGGLVTAIFEPDEAMARKAHRLAPTARMFDDVAALLDKGEMDAVVVAAPNDTHVEILELIAQTRPLPLLMEKPLYTDPIDLPRLQAIADSYPAMIWVAMEYRYMPPIAHFLDRAAAVTGGIKMLTIREHRFPFLHKVGNWNRFNTRTGGTMVEKCCHFFDLMRLTLGAEPLRVMASGGQAVNHKDEAYGGTASDIWDHGYAIVEFDTGVRAMLELCMFAEGSRYQEEVSAVGPLAKIEAQVPGPGRFWNAIAGPAPIPRVIVSPRDGSGVRELDVPVDPRLLAAGDHNGSTYYQHARFAKAVADGTDPEVSLADGIIAVRMGLAAQHSAQTGRMVDL